MRAESFLRLAALSAIFWIPSSILIFSAAQPAPASDSYPVRAVVNREYLPTVLDMIASAQTSLRIIQYEYVSHGAVRKIEEAILSAARRGVDVRILIDDTVRQSKKNVEWLARKGIRVKLDETREYGQPGDKTTHAKMILVDDKKFIIGSTNFSDKSISDNNEANLYLARPAAARSLRTYFEALWKNAVREPSVEPFRSADVDVIFNRQYVPSVKRLFQSARKRIHVILYGINIGRPGSGVRDLIEEMKQARDRGVDVRVILDVSRGSFAEKTLQFSREAASYLEKSGIAVKFDSEEVITHAKVLLVDDAVVVGGTNWGYGPLTQYNDMNVIVRRPEIVGRFASGFSKLWSGAARF